MGKVKLCECGCGMPAPIAKMTSKRKGHIKGKPVRFILGHSFHKYNWKGGISKTSDGRLKIIRRDYPRANNRHILRAIAVAQDVLGKKMPINAVIHHVNEDTGNDKKNNLVICENQAYHMFLHQRKRAYNSCGHANWRKCWICKQYDDPDNLVIYSFHKETTICHKKCENKYRRERYHQKIRQDKGGENDGRSRSV